MSDYDWNMIGSSDEEPVHIDMHEPRVMLICGSRGSGKSQTLGVLAEALSLSRLAVGVILVDRCGVFGRMTQCAEDNQRDPDALARIEAMCREVRVFEPLNTSATPLLLTASELTAADWCQFLGLPADGPRRDLLEQVCRLCQSGYKACGSQTQRPNPHYTVENMLTCMDRADAVTHPESGFTRSTRRAVAQRLMAADSTGLFAAKGLDISDLSVAGQISVIDLSSPALSERAASTIVSILARWILARRFESIRSGDDLIPITWLCVDEAHLFTGKEATDGAADNDLVQYCKIGRKPGCALVLATQQPGAMNPAILSQVDSVISHKLGFRADLGVLNTIIPDLDSVTVTALRNFEPGQAILFDQTTDSGTEIIQVRRRYTMHDGHSAQPQPIETKEHCRRKEQLPDDVPALPETDHQLEHACLPSANTTVTVAPQEEEQESEELIMETNQNRQPTVIRDLGIAFASIILFLAGWLGTLKAHDFLQERGIPSISSIAESVMHEALPEDDIAPLMQEYELAEEPQTGSEVASVDPNAVAIEDPADLVEAAPPVNPLQSSPTDDRSARGRLAMERITSALNRLSD
jgi:hypothetical protein